MDKTENAVWMQKLWENSSRRASGQFIKITDRFPSCGVSASKLFVSSKKKTAKIFTFLVRYLKILKFNCRANKNQQIAYTQIKEDRVIAKKTKSTTFSNYAFLSIHPHTINIIIFASLHEFLWIALKQHT